MFTLWLFNIIYIQHCHIQDFPATCRCSYCHQLQHRKRTVWKLLKIWKGNNGSKKSFSYFTSKSSLIGTHELQGRGVRRSLSEEKHTRQHGRKESIMIINDYLIVYVPLKFFKSSKQGKMFMAGTCSLGP